MTPRLRHIILLALLTSSWQGLAHSGSLRKVWELDLREKVRGSADDLPVFALRFSPDGQQIAAVVHSNSSSPPRMDELFVIDTQQRKKDTRKIEIAEGVFDDDNGHGRLNLVWTASGDAIVAVGVVVRVRDEQACKLLLQDSGMPVSIPA